MTFLFHLAPEVTFASYSLYGWKFVNNFLLEREMSMQDLSVMAKRG